MKMRSPLSSYAWAPAAVDPAVEGTADAEIKVASLLRTLICQRLFLKSVHVV